ncbi:HMR1 protein, partial [Amia calva]|nr:HMR1 protein [Amia calva]
MACYFPSATHSLRYFYTAISGVSGLPEFSIVGQVDGQPFVYYDSNTQRMVPKTSWMERSDRPQYWENQIGAAHNAHLILQEGLVTVMQHFNHSAGVHTLQWMYGCDWDEKNNRTDGFEQWGYDGRYFISFDLRSQSWIAPVPQAFLIKLKWQANKAQNEYKQKYYTQDCIKSLWTYVDYGRNLLETKVPPEVYVIQKSAGPHTTELSCLATGFSSQDVVLSWQRDGQELHEGVESGELLSNGNGTYQVRKSVRVSPEDLEGHTYTCHVDHLGEEIVKEWCKREGLREREREREREEGIYKETMNVS